MTPEKEVELFVTLAGIAKVLERVVATQDHHSTILEQHSKILERHSNVLEQHGKMLEKLSAMAEEHSKQICRLDGKIDMLAMWQQSTDQRFTAIMAPYQQRA